MNISVPRGNFESIYGMKREDGEDDVVDDRLEFVIVDGTEGKQSVGTGRLDRNGLQMTVRLRVDGMHLLGTWEECTQGGQRVYGGELEFVPEGDAKFAGMWQMNRASQGEQPELVSGTWTLTKALGGTALI